MEKYGKLCSLELLIKRSFIEEIIGFNSFVECSSIKLEPVKLIKTPMIKQGITTASRLKGRRAIVLTRKGTPATTPTPVAQSNIPNVSKRPRLNKLIIDQRIWIGRR